MKRIIFFVCVLCASISLSAQTITDMSVRIADCFIQRYPDPDMPACLFLSRPVKWSVPVKADKPRTLLVLVVDQVVRFDVDVDLGFAPEMFGQHILYLA